MSKKCTHSNKVCLELKWGESIGSIQVNGESIMNYFANVDLWFCNDCKNYFYYDWHTRTSELLKEPPSGFEKVQHELS